MADRLAEAENPSSDLPGLGAVVGQAGISPCRWPASRTYWILLILLVELQIADILTTNQALTIPGVWELNPLMAMSQAKFGAAWVGAETRGGGLSMPRGHRHAPALADHFRGVGLRPRRSRQHQPFLTAAARIRAPRSRNRSRRRGSEWADLN
jgi:hypothetical protein